MGDITGKVAIVTGSGRGLGRAEAIELAKLGARVVVSEIDRPEAKEAAEQRGARVLNNLSSKTDYLVMGQASGSKAEKARDLGVIILSEAEWILKIR